MKHNCYLSSSINCFQLLVIIYVWSIIYDAWALKKKTGNKSPNSNPANQNSSQYELQDIYLCAHYSIFDISCVSNPYLCFQALDNQPSKGSTNHSPPSIDSSNGEVRFFLRPEHHQLVRKKSMFYWFSDKRSKKLLFIARNRLDNKTDDCGTDRFHSKSIASKNNSNHQLDDTHLTSWVVQKCWNGT